MIWISLVSRIPSLFAPREDQDVTDYVTRHLLKGLPEGKPMIDVTDEARDHIREKGGSIYLLDTKPVGLCCGRVAFEPQLTIGVPAKRERYVRDVINDIQVYIPKWFLGPLSPDHRREKAIRAQDPPPQRLAAHLTAPTCGEGSRLDFYCLFLNEYSRFRTGTFFFTQFLCIIDEG